MTYFVQRKAVRLNELWEALSRNDIRELECIFQLAKEPKRHRPYSFEKMDILFLFEDAVYVYETTNTEKPFWVAPNTLDPFGEVPKLDYVIKTAKSARQLLDTMKPKRTYKHLGAYCSNWTEILAVATILNTKPPENWPSDDEYPRIPFVLKDKDENDE